MFPCKESRQPLRLIPYHNNYNDIYIERERAPVNKDAGTKLARKLQHLKYLQHLLDKDYTPCVKYLQHILSQEINIIHLHGQPPSHHVHWIRSRHRNYTSTCSSTQSQNRSKLSIRCKKTKINADKQTRSLTNSNICVQNVIGEGCAKIWTRLVTE